MTKVKTFDEHVAELAQPFDWDKVVGDEARIFPGRCGMAQWAGIVFGKAPQLTPCFHRESTIRALPHVTGHGWRTVVWCRTCVTQFIVDRAVPVDTAWMVVPTTYRQVLER